MAVRNKVKSDTILKNFWKDNERFADLFNAYLFQGKKVIRSEDLTEVDTDISSLIKLNGHVETIQKIIDVVKRSANGVDYVILGIENQSKIHYAMPLRHMVGDAFNYLKEFNEIAAKNIKQKKYSSSDEFLSKFKRTDRLHPVVTLCIYYGEDEWDGPRSLIDMLNIPEELNAIISDYKFNLLEIRKSEHLKFCNTDVDTVFNIIRFIYNKEYDKMNEIYKEQTISPELAIVIGAITETQKMIDDALRLEKEGGTMNMCKALEELEEKGRLEGRKEGREEGKVEGAIAVYKKMNISKQDTLKNIVDDFAIEYKDAEEYIEKYW